MGKSMFTQQNGRFSNIKIWGVKRPQMQKTRSIWGYIPSINSVKMA